MVTLVFFSMEKLLPIAEFSPLWPYPSGVGSVIGCFVIIWIMNWALNSAIFGRNWQIVKVHIDVQTAEPENKKFTLLNEMTEEVTIPTTLLQHFTRRQLNGLMKSTSFIPPITVNPYVSPFHLYKNSIKLKFKHLSDGLPVFDLSLRFVILLFKIGLSSIL